MQEKTERWKQLCEEAAVEKDPRRLLELTREINDLLLGKQRRLERPDDEPQK
jgi:circadian clock protein KaiB